MTCSSPNNTHHVMSLMQIPASMIRGGALLLCLASSVAAQGFGVPPAIAPCADLHLDPARYRADLEGRGWLFVPPFNRATQIELLNETFVALVAGRDGPRDDRLAQSRTVWANLGESQLLFTTPDGAQALMVSGGVTDDGESQLRCWMAFVDGTRLDTLYDQLLARTDETPEPGEEQVIFLTPPSPDPNDALRLFLTRPTPGIDTPATRAGIATVLITASGGTE